MAVCAAAPRWCGVLLMLLVLVPLLDTLAIWTWKLMVDDVLVPRRFDPFWTIMATFVTLTMAGAVLKFTDDYLSTWLGERFVLTMRTSVFRHLERLSPDFYTRSRQGDVQVRLNGDVAAIQTFVLSGHTQGVAAILRILFFAGALFVAARPGHFGGDADLARGHPAPRAAASAGRPRAAPPQRCGGNRAPRMRCPT